MDNLRKHLAQVTLARRVLPEDVAARQKLLEASVYDVAVERLKHEAKIFDEIGLGHVDVGLRRADLQRWMWDWHQKLRVRLETEIADIIATEAKQTRGMCSLAMAKNQSQHTIQETSPIVWVHSCRS